MILCSFVAELAPIDTRSSCPLELTMESQEAGHAYIFFWLTRDASAYCGIMNPELRPGFATRNSGSPRCPSMSWATRRSEMLPSSARATPM